MRKSKLVSYALVLAMTASSLVGFTANADAAKKAAPKLSAKTKSVSVGGKFTVKVKKTTGVKKIAKVTWKSSAKKVAAVKKSGALKAKVTAKKAGKAKITAKVKYTLKSGKSLSKKLKCAVTVTAAATTVSPTAPVTSVAPTAAPTVAPTTAPSSAPTAEATATPVRTAKPTPTPYVLPEESLKENADFNVGTVISYDKKNSIFDKNFTKLAAQQFDIVTCENEMKGYSLLDTSASQAAEDGMPVCQFERADEMVQWAKDNGLKVRGHVLIWEQSMSDSFFYVGYDTDKELVDAETLKARMQSYCKQVVTHFEEKFPGTVICWDVVNEAINADEKAEKDPTTGLYLNNTGKFYQILGGEYIKYAFQYAKEAVAAAKAINPDSDISLYYNDFNTFEGVKTDRILALIDYLNKDEKLLDCMGMEGYVLTYWPNAKDVQNAMTKFANKNVKVGINELTVRLNKACASKSEDGVTDADITAHATKYEDMFKAYTAFNKAKPGVLTNVSIWGLIDRPDLVNEADKADDVRDYDYDVYGTNSGLFSDDYREKDAFNKVIQVLKDAK